MRTQPRLSHTWQIRGSQQAIADNDSMLDLLGRSTNIQPHVFEAVHPTAPQSGRLTTLDLGFLSGR